LSIDIINHPSLSVKYLKLPLPCQGRGLGRGIVDLKRVNAKAAYKIIFISGFLMRVSRASMLRD